MKFPKIRRRTFFISLLMAPLVAAIDAFYAEPRWLKLRRFGWSGPALGMRLAFLTDIHHRGNAKFLQSAVDRINKLRPDLVCFSGDLIEETIHLPEALKILAGLKAPLFAVPGNHDYWAGADFDEIDQALRAGGGRWLMDEEIVFGGKLLLRGLTCQKPVSFSAATLPSVVLIHYPEWAGKLNGLRADLLLAGHSHGGQVRLPFYGPLVTPYGVGPYDYGHFQTPAGPLYVSAGVGWFYFPVRFNCRPEIILFQL